MASMVVGILLLVIGLALAFVGFLDAVATASSVRATGVPGSANWLWSAGALLSFALGVWLLIS